MKIGIISDIHCDIGALKQALEHMGTVDHLFCAGDLVLQYRFSNEVIDLMRQMRIPTISGNHDLSVLSSAGAALRASGSASAENLDYLAQLPQHISCEIDGKRIVVMHTSKLDPSNHLPEYEPSDANLNIDQQADVLIVGHTHWPVISQVGKILLINPGSLGQPRNPDSPSLRTYALLDTTSWEASIQTFDRPIGM